MVKARKDKEDEVFQAKQLARNAMIAAQAERLSALADSEDARVEGQVKAKEEADERKRLEKEELRRRFEGEMMRSREAQIIRKKNEREQTKMEDAETAKFLGEWCKVLDKQEQEETELKRIAAKRLAEEHRKQVEMHRGKKGGEK